MLGLGRALGETIAVYVILGLDFAISPHILEHGGTSVASFIAAEFGAGGKLGTANLLMLGFVLFTFTLIVNLVASMIVNRSGAGRGSSCDPVDPEVEDLLHSAHRAPAVAPRQRQDGRATADGADERSRV